MSSSRIHSELETELDPHSDQERHDGELELFGKKAPEPGAGELHVDGEFELGVESVGCLAGNDDGGKNKAKESTYKQADHQGHHRFPLSSRLSAEPMLRRRSERAQEITVAPNRV